jgi:hypothetical protein
MIRFNTDTQYVESYNTTTLAWQSAGGTANSGITYSQAQASSIEAALIFG